MILKLCNNVSSKNTFHDSSVPDTNIRKSINICFPSSDSTPLPLFVIMNYSIGTLIYNLTLIYEPESYKTNGQDTMPIRVLLRKSLAHFIWSKK